MSVPTLPEKSEALVERPVLAHVTAATLPQADPEFARQLPYHFARAHGVLAARAVPEGAEIWVRPEINTAVLGEVRRVLGLPLKPVMLPADVFERRLAQAYTREHSDGIASLIDDISGASDLKALAEGLPVVTDLLDAEDDAPIIRFLNALLTQALRERASDIHIEAFEGRSLVRLRTDGTLREVLEPPRALHAALVSRVKVMAQLDIAEKRLPQDGRITLRIAGRPVDVRVSTLPTGHGERVVLRLLDKETGVLDFTALGMSEATRDRMDQLVRRPHGIVLVTGPTGSGKTTTLYAALSRLDADRLNIMTVEDPIEYDLDGIGQTQVNPGIDMTFARALRAILRQDPDVVMIGEIRDLETARIAVQASLTGHLVLATLHTNDAVGAVTRLIDMGVEPFLLASTLLGVLAQRLVRRLCPHCKALAPADADHHAERPASRDERAIYRAVGCTSCSGTGYRGRTGIYELLIADRAFSELVHAGASEQLLREHMAKQGTVGLSEDGMRWIAAGETTLEEVLRVARAAAESDT
jgi:general secretion pathway protein E